MTTNTRLAELLEYLRVLTELKKSGVLVYKETWAVISAINTELGLNTGDGQ